RQYHLVEERMTWTEAQSYCRQHYTDLATVTSEEDVVKLNDALGSYRSEVVWIGLYDGINNWKWSLQNKNYYGEGEAEFRMWGGGQPNNGYLDEYCVAMNREGQWLDYRCSDRFPFICYNGLCNSEILSIQYLQKTISHWPYYFAAWRMKSLFLLI
uniref:C-type lectin domain-containing protein n=1 Tax=Myripristis murdjan TaxID=586833 RepID=A0A667WMA1_9TELE